MSRSPEAILADMIAKNLIIQTGPDAYKMTPKGWLLSLRAEERLKKGGRHVD